MAYEQIQVDLKEGVATITLNRPAKLNAYTAQMGTEIHRAFAELDANDEARVIVVTGAGRAFCAGADLAARGGATFDRSAQNPDPNPRAEAQIRPWNMKKPIIAAINGPAVGVGITLPMQWDIRVAAESARIGFVFVRRGVIPEALSTWLLPRLIGVAKANELLLTGRIITAKEALDFGIVSHVWPDAEFRQKVSEMASDIAANTAPVSVAITKRLIYGLLGEPSFEKGNAVDHKAFNWAGAQADSREGVSSFLEKRKPAWKMKPSKDFPDFLPEVK
jgi:enoyl-CoA hydratase/carnithine racemase